MLKRFERGGVVTDVVVSPTEIAVSLGIVGLKLDRPLERPDRFAPTFALAERIAQIVISLGVIGPELNYALVRFDGLRITAQLVIHPRQRAVSVNEIRFGSDRLFVSVCCLCDLIEMSISVAEIIVCFGVIGFEVD